jgi:hypothetical protein
MPTRQEGALPKSRQVCHTVGLTASNLTSWGCTIGSDLRLDQSEGDMWHRSQVYTSESRRVRILEAGQTRIKAVSVTSLVR